MRSPLVFLVSCLAASPARAQLDPVTTAPPNLVLSNYNSTPVGPYGGLEGVAYVARIDDPSAAWFNPAGLARQSSAEISGSAGVYQHTVVSPVELPNQGGSIQQLPNFVGFTFSPHAGVIAGAALLSTNAWSQETSAERISAAANQRFAYTANSDFQLRVLAVSAGYHRGGPWRFGGGVALSLMDLGLTQGASDRVATSTVLQSLLVSARAGGSALQLRGQGGVQYDRRRWRLGAAVRTPGATLHRTAEVLFDGVLDTGAAGAGASLFDTEAALEYHQPWEFQGGAALVTDRIEAEVDFQAYTPIDAYPMVSTDRPVLVYTSPGTGAPPAVASRPFPGFISAARGIVNGAAGGHVKLLKGRDLRLHGGFSTNASPVASGDTVFNRVDLTVWSVGLSGTFGKFQFAAGLHREAGRSDSITLRNLINGESIQTPIDVHMTGVIYSLAYQF